MELTLTLIDDVQNAKINSSDAESLDIIDGDVVFIMEPITSESIAVRVVVDDSVPAGEIHYERSSAESSGFSDGQSVGIAKYDGMLKTLKEVTFTVESADGSDVNQKLLKVREHRGRLKAFLDGRLVFMSKTFKYRWDEFGAIIGISETDPPLSPEQVYVIEWESLKAINFAPAIGKGDPFNGILIIDVSGSMTTEDMTVHDIGPIRGLAENLESGSLKSYLEGLAEGTTIQRWQGAALAALAYLAEKVGRGHGEKVSFILFSDTAAPIDFNGRSYIGSDDAKAKMGETMGKVWSEIENGEYSGTEMAKAFDKAIEIGSSFESDMALMVVLLTDGYPNSVEATLAKVEELKRRLPNAIVYGIGIGGSNDPLMTKIANMTNGVYYSVADFGDLLKWYSKLAKDIKTRIELDE